MPVLLVLRLRFRGRLVTDGPCFICPHVKLEIGRGATLLRYARVRIPDG